MLYVPLILTGMGLVRVHKYDIEGDFFMCIFPCKSHSLNHVSGARAEANHVSASVMN